MAMAEKIKKRAINLLPHKGEALFEQFLSWALTVGRLLIIITETLALSVFLYRFILDVQIIDLHDKIKAESAIVGSFKTQEEAFRNLQTRLLLAKNFDSKKDTSLSLLQATIELGRNKVTFKNITIGVDSMVLELQASSATLLNNFVKGLRSNPDISDVSIDRVENSPSTGLVTLAITAKRRNNLQKISIPTDIKDLKVNDK